MKKDVGLPRAEKNNNELRVIHDMFLFRLSMMQSCWEHKDTSRPTFSEIVSFLGTHLEKISDYFDLTGAVNGPPPIRKVNKEESSDSKDNSISPTLKHNSLTHVPA